MLHLLDYWNTACIYTSVSSTTATAATPAEQQTITPSPQKTKIVLERRVDADDSAVYHLIVACTIVVGVATVLLLIVCVICIYKQHFKSYCKRMDFEQGGQKLEFIRKYFIIFYTFLIIIPTSCISTVFMHTLHHWCRIINGFVCKLNIL